MGRWRTAFAAWLASAGLVAGQTPTRAVQDVPPLSLPVVGESTGLPNGTAVSRPLQSVSLPEPTPLSKPGPADPPPSIVEASDLTPCSRCRPLGNSWYTIEYLVWWPKGQPLPPLVTANRTMTPPALGSPTTSILIGGSRADSPDISGGRFTFGWALNEEETTGIELTYFFLGSRTLTEAVAESGLGRPRFVGRPVVDPNSGLETVVPVAVPGRQIGSVIASTTTRVSGWEVTGVGNLLATQAVRINALAGYRYLMVNEGLRIEQYAFHPAGMLGAAPVLASAADQFDADNRFHGGQLGLHADITRGGLFAELTGKIGLGQAVQVVRVSGQSASVSPGFPFPGVTSEPYGVLGQPSNLGRMTRSVFAVLPEASVKVGCRFRDHTRLYVGYNFLYLSDTVRPGDQVDRTVDPVSVPLGPGPIPLGDRPGPILIRSDFWVQGLLFGLECRY